MSSSKLRIQTVIDKIFRFAQERTELHLSHSYWLLSEDTTTEVKSVDEEGNEVSKTVVSKAKKVIVPFELGIGLVYSPEYRLAAPSEELIVDKLHSLHLPAPSFYLTDSTPEDDPALVEELKHTPPVVQTLDEDEEMPSEGELVLAKVGGNLGKKIKYTKISTLYNADTELLDSLKVSLGISKRSSVKATPVKKTKKIEVSKDAIPVMRPANRRARAVREPAPEPVEESINEPVEESVEDSIQDEVCEVKESLEEPVEEPVPEPSEEPELVIPVRARPRQISRRVIRTPKPL